MERADRPPARELPVQAIRLRQRRFGQYDGDGVGLGGVTGGEALGADRGGQIGLFVSGVAFRCHTPTVHW